MLADATARKDEEVDGAVPMTEEVAWAILHRNEELFEQADVSAILQGFHDDVVVRFAEIPEFRGKEALKRFLAARFARQRGYRLRKSLRAIGPDQGVVVGTWTGEWEDTRTGKRMRGRGTEVLTMRHGLCTEWDATFNVWEDGAAPTSAIL
jgi:nuclear transport factor 2 (NTF2) superfamily protein